MSQSLQYDSIFLSTNIPMDTNINQFTPLALCVQGKNCLRAPKQTMTIRGGGQSLSLSTITGVKILSGVNVPCCLQNKQTNKQKQTVPYRLRHLLHKYGSLINVSPQQFVTEIKRSISDLLVPGKQGTAEEEVSSSVATTLTNANKIIACMAPSYIHLRKLQWNLVLAPPMGMGMGQPRILQ